MSDPLQVLLTDDEGRLKDGGTYHWISVHDVEEAYELGWLFPIPTDKYSAHHDANGVLGYWPDDLGPMRLPNRKQTVTGLEDNELLLRCQCYSKDHLAFLVYEPYEKRGNTLKAENDDWYLGFSLDPVQPWWKRVWRALRPHRKFGIYAEIVLTNADARNIAEFIRTKLELP